MKNLLRVLCIGLCAVSLAGAAGTVADTAAGPRAADLDSIATGRAPDLDSAGHKSELAAPGKQTGQVARPDTQQAAPKPPLYRPAQQMPPPQNSAVTAAGIPAAAAQPAAQLSDADQYLAGKRNGKLDAEGKKAWILAGLPGICCYGAGGIGIILSFMVPPEPPESALLGKSTSYIFGYTEAYKSAARWKNAKWATLGCGIGTAVTVIVYLLAMQSMEGIY
ncbi:MAG: hypothetical protein ABSF80_05600 [Chitinispirillaceae bacterium]|jgi:hypothetical protein